MQRSPNRSTPCRRWWRPGATSFVANTREGRSAPYFESAGRIVGHGENMAEVVHDVFICHASEDKTAVARPLASALDARGLTVWLDQFQIKLGDSLRQKIDEGLRESRFGVVILSPSFFAKRWSRWELDGLVDREVTTGKKVVLPVWHEVDHDEVAAHSPSLANKLAARTGDGLEAVADAVADALGVPITEIDRVPRSAEEEIALLRVKPDGWEYLLFAAVLLRELEALEPKYRDHEIRYVIPSGPPMGYGETMSFLRAAIRNAPRLTDNVNRVLDPAAQERAFGAPGEPGDAERIEHLARRLIDTYGSLMDWALDVRRADLHSGFERAGEIAASLVDRSIAEFRGFVDNTVSTIDEVPARLRAAEDDPESEPISLKLGLVLTVDDALVEEFDAELRRASGH
jgi:hypothetical protein